MPSELRQSAANARPLVREKALSANRMKEPPSEGRSRPMGRKRVGGASSSQRWLSTPDHSPTLYFAAVFLRRTAARLVPRRRGAQLAFLPVVKVVVFIFTVAAVAVVVYIFSLRHRCCLILIRHLHPGSEGPPRVADAFKRRLGVIGSALSPSRSSRRFPINTCSQCSGADLWLRSSVLKSTFRR